MGANVRVFSQWAWIALTIAIATWLLRSHGGEFFSQLNQIPLPSLLAGFFFLVLAKIFLSCLVRSSLQVFGTAASWRDAWRAYNISQLPKYLPGSVWQFIGRAALYREMGVNAKKTGGAIALEIIALLASAFVFGIPAVIAAGAAATMKWPVILVGCILVFIVGAGVLYLFRRQKLRINSSVRREIPTIVFTLAGAWVCLGISFWVLASAFGELDVWLVVSAFAFAYGVGAIAAFAPAGIGVREATLIWILAPHMGAAAALAAGAAHRGLYIAVDVVLAASAFNPAAKLKTPAR